MSDRRKAEVVTPGKNSEGAPGPGLLTLEEAAQYLNMSPRFMRRAAAERRVAFIKVGRSVRFKITDLDEWIEESRVEPLTINDVWRSARRIA